MRTVFILLSLAVALGPLHAKSNESPFPLTTTVLATPSSASSHSPALSTSSDGDVYLSWIEPTDSGGKLLVSSYDQANQKWALPHLVTTTAAYATSSADTPMITAGRNQALAAVWLAQTPTGGTMAYLSRSYDAGATWDSPTALTTESDQVTFPTISFWQSGKILAAWLDGRAGTTSLYARIVGNDEPDTLIDDSVSRGSTIGVTVFPNSSALLVYRSHNEDDTRDIKRVSWNGREWAPSRLLNNDGFRTTKHHNIGMRLDSVGGQAAATWFTTAFNSPRILISTSPDAGARFTMPQRIDTDHATGRADLKMLRDGSAIAIWQENGNLPGLYLRRVAPSLTLNPAVRLAITQLGESIGDPRLALRKDYDSTPAELIVTYSQNQQIHSLLVTLPDLSTLAGRKPCLPCDEDDANATRGYPVKGIVTRVMPDRGMVIVKHEEIPGVMRAMTMAFKVEAETLAQLSVDQALLGRIERRGRDWHLFSVKLLGSPINETP